MSELTLQKLKNLRDALPYGAVSRIARRSKYDRTYVSRVLHGKCFNLRIIAEAIKLRKEHEEKLNKLNSLINEN